ncbi:ABC transporter substrate-binding protein [Devosia epidermidihirudinis]|uniref:ABC transporter substrate-binding protein n=2 Tax=Devosia epidermidihirudinis TaxID=1293439 RepID=A0A0F5QCX1_9HYPH|nr:ABC transporter substrate-binding protein [Devosia epidermidihirudinis]
MAALATGLSLAALLGPAAAQNIHPDVLELKLALAVADTNVNPTTSSLFKLAESMGFYEKHGLKIDIVSLDGTPQAVAALNSGAVDIADIAIDSAIRLRADNDVPVRGFVAIAMGSAFLIAAKDDITTVDDLVGRSYAIADNGSLDHNLTEAVLGTYGIASDGPNYVAIGSPDVRVQALAAGQVDATTVSFGTYMTIAGTPGVHVLVQPDAYSERAPAMAKFIAALDGTIETKREALQRFTDALTDAARTMEANREGWVDAMVVARDDLSRESLEATSELNATRWCINGCMKHENLEKAVDFIYAKSDFKDVAKISVDDIIDLSFTQKTLETLGTAGGNGLDAR